MTPFFNFVTFDLRNLLAPCLFYCLPACLAPGNNCICRDHCQSTEQCQQQIQGDVAALRAYNFDSWKLDGCGGETNLVDFNKYLAASGKPIMVENCHWGIVVSCIPMRSNYGLCLLVR